MIPVSPENEDNFVLEISPEVWATIKRQISEEDTDSINLLYSPYWRKHE